MRHLIFAVAISLGFAACGDDEETACEEGCIAIEDVEAGYGSPRGLLTVKAYLRYGEGRQIEIQAPIEVGTHKECLKGTTTVNAYLEPMFISIDCQDVTDEAELAEIRRLTGVAPGFLSPAGEDWLSDIEITDGGRAHVECFYNTE